MGGLKTLVSEGTDVFVEIVALDGFGDDAGADDEVAEFFAIIALFGVAMDDRTEEGGDFGLGDVAFVEFTEALAGVAAAEIDVVALRTAADEADLGDVGAGAAVRATSHANGDGIVAQAGGFDFFFNVIDQHGQIALGFGKGEGAGGQGNAGERVQAQGTAFFAVLEAVFLDEGLDRRALGRGDIGDDDVLVRSEAEVAGVNFGDFLEAGADGVAGPVNDTSTLDEQGEMRISAGVSDPAITITVVFENKRAHGLQIPAEVFVEFVQEPLGTVVLDGVFQAGVLAVGAAAEIALDLDNHLGNFGDLLGCTEADDVGNARECLLGAVGHAHATTDSDIVTDQLVFFDNGDEREAVRVNVDIVRRRHSDGDFEFAGQVGLAVDGLDFLLGGFDFFAIQPDFVISAGARSEVIGDVLCCLQRGGMDVGEMRVGIAHHIAIHVTAGGDRVHGGLIDFLDGAFQVRLDHAVELKGLAGGELEIVVAVFFAKSIGGEPLSRGGNTTRHADADHEGISFFQAVLAAIGTEIAIVLHIGTVEFDELLAVFRDRTGGDIRELLGERAAEVIRADFDVFVGG